MGLVMGRFPGLLLGAYRDIQLPLLDGFLLYLALSIASISELCTSVCSIELSSAGLKLPAIARG